VVTDSRILGLTAAALILAYATVGAFAQTENHDPACGPLYNPRVVPPDPERGVSTAPHRKIIHINMDAFNASVEHHPCRLQSMVSLRSTYCVPAT
jgi:hypothetical protein